MFLRSIKDATKALQVQFSAAKSPLSLPAESRRMLQTFVEDQSHGGSSKIDEDESARANAELKLFWERYVADNPQKTAAFAGVLRELRPAIVAEESLLEWYAHAIKPVIASPGFRKVAVEDAQEFLASVMIYDEEGDDSAAARTSARICNDLLNVYLARTNGLTEEDAFVAPENAQVANQVETVLVTYGRKMPQQLFAALNGLIVTPTTRIQGLTLLSGFLRHQAPHLYRVLQTPLVENLLKCLMNDTSTTVLSVALTSLIMLLPHIPGSLANRLPRLFLIYSRLLCWEKFSPLSTEAQRNLVTDDRISVDPDSEHGDVGIDPTWQKVRPKQGLVESTTPEVMTYFTYLYGLYPLNFMSYIRKPRRYLKNLSFPGADDFDLDQAVIRGRSDQFRSVHLLHPNFYNMTVDEELSDPKWPKMDPADVVAECHGLCINTRPSLVSPGPPPSSKLPDIPPVPPLPGQTHGTLSPAISHASLRSGSSWRDTATAVSADAESPILGPRNVHSDDDIAVEPLRPRSKASTHAGSKVSSPNVDEFPMVPGGPRREPAGPTPTNNLAFLQRELTLLRNELNFERWHKAQYSQHIGQLMRKNVKDATAEAETLNLINANRALKQQLDQVRSAREATLKDSALSRKQVTNMEHNMGERLAKLKKEQETWIADADELRRLRAEMKQYRDLQSAAEARAANQSHQLEILQRDSASRTKLNADLLAGQRRIRELEYREYELDLKLELLASEKGTLELQLQRHIQDRDRMRKAHAERLAELENQLAAANTPMSPSGRSAGHDSAALADAQAKLAQLKKAHSRLLDKYTDLELEYSSAKSQLDALQGIDPASLYTSISRSNSLVRNHHPSDHPQSRHYLADGGDAGPSGPIGVLESVYDVPSEYGGSPPEPFAYASASDPTPRRFGGAASAADTIHAISSPHPLPISPPRSETTMTGHHGSSSGMNWKPAPAAIASPSTSSRHASGVASRDSFSSHMLVGGGGGGALGYNKTAPLGADERSLAGSRTSTEHASLGPSGSGTGTGTGAKKAKAKIQPQSEVRVYGRGECSRKRISGSDGLC